MNVDSFGAECGMMVDAEVFPPPAPSPQVKVIVGTIVRRRILGKKLAFADVRCDIGAGAQPQSAGTSTVSTSDDEDVVQVAFHRASLHWDESLEGNYFPTKNSLLPYGARVEVTVVKTAAPSTRSRTPPTPPGESPPSSPGRRPEKSRDGGGSSSLVVRSWRILSNPAEDARRRAAVDTEGGEGGGMSCSAYLRARKEAHLVAQPPTAAAASGSDAGSRAGGGSRRRVRAAAADGDVRDEDPVGGKATPTAPSSGVHGNAAHKALRSKIFARWLIDTFGSEMLREGTGVLDVAGGRGDLSVELAAAASVPCTVVDPLVRKRGDKAQRGGENAGGHGGGAPRIGLSSRDRKRLGKVEAPVPWHVAAPFGAEFPQSSEKRAALVEGASCFVAMHPDECTEDVLDVALLYDKPVAIIPCCVFPTLFPHRMLASEKVTGSNWPVSTYDDFLLYLLEKDDRLSIFDLPFEGRNRVIYLKP